ncbi:MAG TPA: hypothetical protein PLF35_06240 [Prolixibacteraceae bacterium]|nr:hypothetical protein [Prolixibacteraceae bacterium]
MMNNTVIDILLTSVVGIPLAFIVLRLFFKNSVLHRITTLWVIDILIVDALGELGNAYPNVFPLGNTTYWYNNNNSNVLLYLPNCT